MARRHARRPTGGVFTSTSSAHGGQESTLLSMTLPLLHHGMLIVGVPYTEAALFDTRTGGSPYGATHLATPWNTALSKDEIAVAHALGARSRADRDTPARAALRRRKQIADERDRELALLRERGSVEPVEPALQTDHVAIDAI